MNLYVETNFLLEMVLFQEEENDCQELLTMALSNHLSIRIPTFSIFETIERVHRLNIEDQGYLDRLREHVKFLKRSLFNKNESKQLEESIGIFEAVKSERNKNLKKYSEWIRNHAHLLFRGSDFLAVGFANLKNFELSLEDSIVFSEVLFDIEQNKCQSVFVTRNKEDFQAPEIINALSDKNCKLLFSFRSAKNFISHKISLKDADKDGSA